MFRCNNRGEKKFTFFRILFWVVTGIAVAFFFAAVFAVAVTYLWNWLMPDIFGLKQINYLQALGLIVLSRLLVGGWHRNHGHGRRHFHDRFRKKCHEGIQDKRDSFDEFWDEQGRELFRKYMEERGEGAPR